jgi:TonB family protein
MMPVANDPIPAAEPTRAARPRRVEVVVLGDDEFLIELGPLLGDGYRTRPVDSPAAIAAVIAENGQEGDKPPTMIMMDAGTQSDPRAAVSQMENAHPNIPIIVIAASRDESVWGSALARGAIIAVIARSDLGSEPFKAALGRAETRARSAPQTPPPGQVAAPAKSNSKLLIAAAVAVALAAGGWFMLHQSSSQTASKPTVNVAVSKPVQSASAVKPQSPLELLSAARVAFRDQKLLPRMDAETHGDSALELYAQVLAQDPKNDEAIDGVQRLFGVVKARVQGDLSANRLDDALKLLTAFKATNVEPDGVRDLDAAINAARPKIMAARIQELLASGDFNDADQMIQQLVPLDRAAAAELRRAFETRRADQQLIAQLSSLSASVKTAIDAGNLIEPANDNARTRLQSMRQIGRSHPLTLAAQRDVLAALINRAQDQASKEQFDAAGKLLGVAGEIAVTPEVADAKRQLQADIDAVGARAALAAAAKKTADSALANAATDSAGASPAPVATSSYIAARPTSPLRVVYPSGAAEKQVQGYVVIEFTLQPDGKPSQPTIVEANPQRIFDSAAIEAVMGGRYDTSRLIDKTPKRARVRLSFRPG